MPVFNWNYFSFYDFDSTWFYRELALIPLFVAILWIVWMKVVRNSLKEVLSRPEAMSLEEAYATAVINDALDTDTEEDEDEADNKKEN